MSVERSYHVAPLHIRHWGASVFYSEGMLSAVVARQVNTTVWVVDLSWAYATLVFDGVITSQVCGWTPNSDVLCNYYIKLGLLGRLQFLMGYHFMFTGHYAKIIHVLLKAATARKDQSYFLCVTLPNQFCCVAFILGSYNKHQVRFCADLAGLVNSKASDSTGTCLVVQQPRANLVGTIAETRVGLIKTKHQKLVGEHAGCHTMTTGQVCGGSFVAVGSNIKTNTLVAAARTMLVQLVVVVVMVDMICSWPAKLCSTVFAKVRSTQHYDIPCLVSCCHLASCACCLFWCASYAVMLARGQFIVFYVGALCLGGGRILSC